VHTRQAGITCATITTATCRSCVCLCVLQDMAQGPDAVPDSATTESDSVSDVQLLRSGGDERTLFKLTLQVSSGAARTCVRTHKRCSMLQLCFH
jgi:hypothetical protein